MVRVAESVRSYGGGCAAFGGQWQPRRFRSPRVLLAQTIGAVPGGVCRTAHATATSSVRMPRPAVILDGDRLHMA
jgi:hypothetical protein